MMVEKEVLGLSLGLSCSSSSSSSSSENHQRSPLQLTLMPMSISSSLPLFLRGKPQPQHQWADLMAPSEMLKEIDVNRLPAGEKEKEEEEEAGVSSPNNSTFSSVSAGKRDLAAFSGGAEEHDGERACSRGSGGSDEEDGEGSRKKLRLSKDQSAILEENFKEHNTLNPKQKLTLAKQLNLRPRQVEVWFQNRRARTKLKQTEVDCEFLKRCCDNLTEENRRLQKEVAELRALKLSPQFYMHMTPPTTLTMCPSCERMQLSNKTANNNEGNSSKGSLIYGDKPSVSPWALIPLRPPFVHAAPQRS